MRDEDFPDFARMDKRAVVAAAAGVGVAALLARWATRLSETDGVVCSPLRAWFLKRRLRRWDKLIIIADFDRTVTTSFLAPGIPGASSHGILEACKSLTPEYRDKAQSLFDKYHPIENSPTLTREEKLPIMQEWYKKSHALLMQENITEQVIREAVKEASVRIRPGFRELMQQAKEAGIPLVVFSAGLGNVVQEVLRQRLEGGEELPVVSNWLHFGANGKVCGFAEPLTHMFNKDGERIIEQLGTKWERVAQGRDCALLLGDGLGDATMANGLGLRSVARVGFLNEVSPAEQRKRLHKYTKAFDAVILADGPMDWIMQAMDFAAP